MSVHEPIQIATSSVQETRSPTSNSNIKKASHLFWARMTEEECNLTNNMNLEEEQNQKRKNTDMDGSVEVDQQPSVKKQHHEVVS